MNDKNHIKERIRKVLIKHPEGLHIHQITMLVGVHRHTVTKYIHELIGAGVIYQREVGPIKLCFLKESFTEVVRKKEILEKLKKRLAK